MLLLKLICDWSEIKTFCSSTLEHPARTSTYEDIQQNTFPFKVKHGAKREENSRASTEKAAFPSTFAMGDPEIHLNSSSPCSSLRLQYGASSSPRATLHQNSSGPVSLPVSFQSSVQKTIQPLDGQMETRSSCRKSTDSGRTRLAQRNPIYLSSS